MKCAAGFGYPPTSFGSEIERYFWDTLLADSDHFTYLPHLHLRVRVGIMMGPSASPPQNPGMGSRGSEDWPIGLTHRADPSNRGMGGSVWDSATFVPNPSKSNLSTSQIGVHRVQVDFGATILQFKCLFLLVFWFFGDFNLLFQHGAYRKYSSHMNVQDCQI